MSPDPDTVLRRRHTVIIVLRLAAIALAMVGIVTVGRHIVPLTERLIGFDMWSYWAAAGSGAAIFGVPALALALASGRLARWVVPGPLSGCPACGYPVKDHTSPKCPECGTDLK